MSPPSGLPSNSNSLTQAGQIAPDFELPDSPGATRLLSEFAAAGPLALLFYRGHW
jgi:peroxiredoxin